MQCPLFPRAWHFRESPICVATGVSSHCGRAVFAVGTAYDGSLAVVGRVWSCVVSRLVGATLGLS